MINVVYLFGASCSGKSTLGKALQKSLGSQWTYIDRDDLIEQNVCTDLTANTVLEERIQSIKSHIIIDAQIPWRKKRLNELYILVLPPLAKLLERDAVRTINLKRSEKNAYYAREYVIETYNILNGMKKTDFDHCFDSSQISVQDEINTIKTLLYTKNVHIAIAGVTFGLLCVLFSSQEK